MANLDINASSFDWDESDFLDLSSPYVHEDDPWGTSVSEKQFHDGNPSVYGQGAEKRQSITKLDGHQTPSSLPRFICERPTNGTVPEPTGEQASPEEPNQEEPSDRDILSSDDGEDDLYGETELLDDAAFDEPDVVAEYDSSLSEDLFEEDDTVQDLHRSIRIDEFVANIPDSTPNERSQCAELLATLNSARLRHWLGWMTKQFWTGKGLLKFLEFRLNHWEENQEWWEYTYWNRRLQHWWGHSSYYNLTLDATYELIQLRSASSPDDVIASDWLIDWKEVAPWKLGLSSFAEFALFRAGLKAGEDWLRVLISHAQALTDFDSAGERHVERPRRHGPESWFASQDWYDPADWHDNLDWASAWFDSVHPYMPAGSWYSVAEY